MQKPIFWRIVAIQLVVILSLVGLFLSDLWASSVEPAHADIGEPHEHGPEGHEGDEGQVLSSTTGQETVYTAARCAPDATVRTYQLVAINVQITLNRFLDYDPDGRMYVLEDELTRVRQEETQNQAARQDQAEPAVSTGLQGDAIQPLILRVNQGECLRVTLRNDLKNNEPASFHLHGTGLYVVDSAEPAIATNPASIVRPGATVTYEWAIAPDEPEGTHYFHSHGDEREQTAHGLFGALIVEPAGSAYLDPANGQAMRSGWSAMIQAPDGSDFREFAIIYHEIGPESYRHLDKQELPVTLLDRITTSYKPGGFAINYRSEPFRNRLQLQNQLTGRIDMSQPYSSYAFGDPATPIARAYLGDPVKQRVVHGGTEVFHVHHVHGGGIRWRLQPRAESTGFDLGLVKHPALVPESTNRIDSQTVGPSETYDLENECGSGGCQQSVGDYLFHCHVAHHYVSGMWAIWRVYNTLQQGLPPEGGVLGGLGSQDGLPELLELPDRVGLMRPAIDSTALVNRRVDWMGKQFTITQDSLETWVERQLPPAGEPKGYDASVLDWRKEGDLYLNEQETEQVWPGYRSAAPGIRPPLAFDPVTGKLAYPFLRPHLAKRPPFAPNHGPAPFLDPIHQGTDPPQPGENGPWSICPAGTQIQSFAIRAINLPITLNAKNQIVDPVGALYVLNEQEQAIRADDNLKVPLAIRANAGEDCIDVIFTSKLGDTGENHFLSKADMHIHFVQFDVQASDGVNTGFNYEQSVRPFTVEGETVTADASAGADRIVLQEIDRFQPGVLVGVGMDQTATFEIRRVAKLEGKALVFDQSLQFDHLAGEIVSTEFVRYRWYPDVEFGTAYFHDHVSALTSWRHGLFGALISEPPGSRYLDPKTGEEKKTGALVDVHTDSAVSPEIDGSFREMVLFVQDSNRLTHVGDSTGSAINMRVEPLARRDGDPARLFSSQVYGDPETPLLEAYLDDPVIIRGLVPSTNEVHTLHIDGHWFRFEPYSLTSPPINTVHMGISERLDLMIAHAGGPQRRPGDYLYYNGRLFKFQEGSWGLIRVYGDQSQANLRPLPGHESIAPPGATICPDDAPRVTFDVVAVDTPLPMLNGRLGKIFVLADEVELLKSGKKVPEPLVLHVGVGDCLVVTLTNQTQAGQVSFHVDLLASDPLTSLGVEAGNNPAQSVMPGASRVYTYFAHPEVGETVALVKDWGDVLTNPGLGLYGAIVVGAAGTAYSDPVTGADLSRRSGWAVDANPPDGSAYRDFTLFLQDGDPSIGTAIMPYAEDVQGVVGINYRAESLLQRQAVHTDTASLLRSDIFGDPVTPILQAFAGDPVRIHVLVPHSEQAHVFMLDGHRWLQEPGLAGTNLLSAATIGPLEVITLMPIGGAGGMERIAGDYLYGDQRMPYREAGLWGLMRVYPSDTPGTKLQMLPSR